MNEAWIALAAALFGGVGLKAIEAMLNRSSKRADIASQFRDELRGEIDSLRNELQRVEENLTYWRERYYLVMTALNKAKNYLIQAGHEHVLENLEIDKKGRSNASRASESDQD